MRLLFTSGTARGGTNVRTLVLNGHPQIQMSLDPFIALFRFYRDSLLRSVGAEGLLERMPSTVLDDYYFSTTKTAIAKAIQNADPDIPFDMSQWERLKAALLPRMRLTSINLIPHLDKLPAPTFREVFFNTTKVVAAVSDGDLVWAGFNDNWAMEFFSHVARLIPDARFMLHLRDPRAVVCSSEFAEPDPAKRPTVVSFARHLRKYFAFAGVLSADPHLQGRLLITYYEPFIERMPAEVRRMTDFLNVAFHQEMLDVSRFRRPDGSQWPSDWNDYQASIHDWRRQMPREMAELTEFICDPEMRLHGYSPEIYDDSAGLSDGAFAYAQRNARDCLGWRTDFPEIERTLGSELYRKRLLRDPERSAIGEGEIERCFLFREVFDAIGRRLPASPPALVSESD